MITNVYHDYVGKIVYIVYITYSQQGYSFNNKYQNCNMLKQKKYEELASVIFIIPLTLRRDLLIHITYANQGNNIL